MIAWLLFVSIASAEPYGEYLVRAASCRECHTVPAGRDFAGGLRLNAEKFGFFYTPNITPDPETGIGRWNADQFLRALRLGVSPHGSFYYPAFPYRSFSKMTDDDIRRIFLYLQTQTPVYQVNRPHELNFPYDYRSLVFLWQERYFKWPSSNAEENIRIAVGPFVPLPDRTASWNRGAYLVEAVLHCAECHTPRNGLGALIVDQWMAGSELVLGGLRPPNITSDPQTGLQWSPAEWNLFLASGIDPTGRSPGAEMALAVRAASGLTAVDREAVVEYLLSLPPVYREATHE